MINVHARQPGVQEPPSTRARNFARMTVHKAQRAVAAGSCCKGPRSLLATQVLRESGSPCADCGENRRVGQAGEFCAFCRPARPRARPVSLREESGGAGSVASRLCPEMVWALRAWGRIGGVGEGAWRRVSSAHRGRNSRVALYTDATSGHIANCPSSVRELRSIGPFNLCRPEG